jgi:hypothetical protein
MWEDIDYLLFASKNLSKYKKKKVKLKVGGLKTQYY